MRRGAPRAATSAEELYYHGHACTWRFPVGSADRVPAVRTVTRGSAVRRPAPVLLALAAGLGLIGGCSSAAQHPAAHATQRTTGPAHVADVDESPAAPGPLNVY